VLGTSFIHDLIKAVKHLMNMTNSMELSPSWEADSHLAFKEIPHFLVYFPFSRYAGGITMLFYVAYFEPADTLGGFVLNHPYVINQ
jgi:hypothetical protein